MGATHVVGAVDGGAVEDVLPMSGGGGVGVAIEAGVGQATLSRSS